MRARARNNKALVQRVTSALTPQIQGMINTAIQSAPPQAGITTEPPVESTAQSYTLQDTDIGKEVQRNVDVPNVTLLPSTSVIPVGTKQIPIVQTGTGPSSIASANPATISIFYPDGLSPTIISRYSGCFVKPVGVDRWRVFGDLAKLGAPTWSVNPSISPVTGIQGVLITAADGTFTAGATVQSRTFLIDGASAGSGSTYSPSVGNVGHDLQFQIVIVKDGLTAVFTTPALRIVASGDPKPQPNGVGTITGNNRVGDIVTLTVGGYSNAVAGTPGHTVRLYRGATLIQTYTLAAATLTQNYTLASLDEAQVLTMTYQGTNASGQGVESQHSVAFPVAGNPPQYTPGTASITPAVPIVGGVLTANVGTVTGGVGTPVFEWYRDGSLIVGETTSQYTSQSGSSSGVIIPTDVGKTISAIGVVSNAWGTTRISIPGVIVQAAAPPPDTPVPFDNGVPDGGAVIFPVPGGPTSITVGPRPVGMHWTKFTSDYFSGVEKGPVVVSDTLRVNSFRIYGSYKLYWSHTEPAADGVYDFTEWDKADAFFSRSGIEYVQLNLFGVPAGYRAQPESPSTGGWSMQRPTSIVALHNYLNALFNRYSRLKMVEVANEVWTDNRGIAYGVYWVPSVVADPPAGEASLFELMNWVLDWKNAYNAANPTRAVKVQAPSIPGTMFHAGFMLQVFDRYQAIHGRLAEFDSFSIHCYNTDFTNVHLQGSSGSGLYEFCAGLVARGLGGKEVRDGERGFPANTTVSPARVYNTVVRELLLGSELGIRVSGIDFFYYGSPGTDETNLGLNFGPYNDLSLRANGYEHAALLANCTITRVTAGAGTGVNAGKWRVEGFLGSAPAPSPAPPPGPPAPPPPAPAPNAPVMVTSAPRFSSGASTTAVADVPPGTANGDRLTLAVTLIDSTITITDPTGWGTPISSQTSGSGATHVRTQIYERVASSEPASYNITLSGAANWCTSVLRITGDTTTPTRDGAAVQGSGDEPTDPTAPSITTTGANRLLVAFGGQRGGGGITWGAVPGWNMQDTIWQGFPSNLASMHKTQAAAGASGTGVFDSDGSPGDVWTGHMIAYKQ